MRSSIKLQLVVVFLIVVGVGLLSTYMLAGSRSYSEMLDKCVNRCSERGMFGRLVDLISHILRGRQLMITNANAIDPLMWHRCCCPL
jgi:hypothetical protein